MFSRIPSTATSARLTSQRPRPQEWPLLTDPIAQLYASLSERYRIERELGAGGMATVYLAHDLKHDRKVALKVLKPELAAVLGAERFVVEIRTTASLQHPHILPLFDSGTADGFLFYVMPFIEGETLRDKLTRETQLGVEEAVRIATDVADALDYAHHHGVIHRDIKPENILLQEGRPMVADFGIALAVSAAAGGRMTETGLSLGTPHYMSPEQATAEKEITARSDIYSLGSVLYEMLAGQPPHLGGSAQQIIMKIIVEPIPFVTTLRKAVPSNVAAAVAKSLEKLPADRFESAKAFAAALANPAYAGTVRSESGGGAWAGRRRLGLPAAAALAAAALLIGSVGAKVLWRDRVPERITRRFALDFPAGQLPRKTPNHWPMLAQFPDGHGFIYSGPGTSKRMQFWVRSWDRLPSVRIAQSPDLACCAVVSPSGDSIAFLTNPHAIQVQSLSGGLPVVVADSGLTSVTDWAGGIDWGADGWLYASGLAGLVRLSPRGGRLDLVAPLDAQRGDLRFMWPAVIPQAEAALVTVVPARASFDPQALSIGVANFKTGKVEIILQGARAIYSPTGHVIVAKANGVLWAAPFDAKALHVTGPERELRDTVSTGLLGSTPDLSLSATGTLVYSRTIASSLDAVWVERNGTSRPIAEDLRQRDLDGPRLSPDGKRLLISISDADGRQQLWIEPLNGGQRSRLTFDGDINQRAAWRPGTGRITFLSNRGRTGQQSWLYEGDAGGAGRISKPDLHETRGIGGQGWSPDGKWLLYRTDDQAAGNADIMAIRLGIDSTPRPLVATSAEELSPAVSPDGRWLAYSSNQSGRREIYVRPFPEPSDIMYQISSAGGTEPAWNPNGRELFYLDGDRHMVSVGVTTGASFRAGAQRVLFSTEGDQTDPFQRNYDVTPDGQRFVMLSGATSDAARVVVVLGFFNELLAH